MIKRPYIYLSLIILSLLTGCVEKSGYYDDGQQEIIDNLTKNKGWERSYHMTSYDGRECDVYELWVSKVMPPVPVNSYGTMMMEKSPKIWVISAGRSQYLILRLSIWIAGYIGK